MTGEVLVVLGDTAAVGVLSVRVRRFAGVSVAAAGVPAVAADLLAWRECFCTTTELAGNPVVLVPSLRFAAGWCGRTVDWPV